MGNPFKAIAHVFVGLGKLLGEAFGIVQKLGLDDDLIRLVLPYVRQANTKFVDNTERREWCVNILKALNVPEVVARIAVELAYSLYKKELAKVGI